MFLRTSFIVKILIKDNELFRRKLSCIFSKLITWLIKLPLFTKGLDLPISPFDLQNFYFNSSSPRDQTICFLLHYELAFQVTG